MEIRTGSRMCGTCKKRKPMEEFYFIAKTDMEEMSHQDKRPLCLECKEEKDRGRGLEEKEKGKRQKARERNKQYRKSHREQERARVKRWVEANREKMNAYVKKSRQKRYDVNV